MVALYLIVKGANMIAVTYKYGEVQVFFYIGTITSMIMFPLVCMIVSKIILGFMDMLYKNRQLTMTIKHILEIFPEAVLIQNFDEKTQKLLIKFVNNSAKSNIIDYDSPYDKPVLDHKVNFTIKEIKHDNDQDMIINQGSEGGQVTIGQLLEMHHNLLVENQVDVTSSIELTSKLLQEENESRFYTVKTV
mmetsp:Transcript_37766/g.43411  ORF Transcript_37766/g.43411 Transcript_37766/m.43411 type:complete len:190 (-) Transcript_37766:91-660(-)